MSRVIADGLSKRATATTQESQDAVEGKYPDAAGVHAAFNQYGLGSQVIPPDVDLNTGSFVQSGFYLTQASGLINTPPGYTSGRLNILVNAGTSAYTLQIASTTEGSARIMWFRSSGTSVLGTAKWQEIYHQSNILGTVSQSAGVPTGAVIERGSNANGEYTKFADGTMIATIIKFFDTTLKRATSQSLPVTFSVNPVGFAGAIGSTTVYATNMELGAAAIKCGTSAYDIGFMGDFGTKDYQITIIGRWF